MNAFRLAAPHREGRRCRHAATGRTGTRGRNRYGPPLAAAWDLAPDFAGPGPGLCFPVRPLDPAAAFLPADD
jgi:hypothetical protein